MTMTQAAMKAELIGMTLYSTEAGAIEAWAEAFTTYMEDAQGQDSALPIIIPPLRAGGGPKDQMKSGMVGLSTDGAAKIVAGIIAFWAKMILAPATYFVTTIGMTAPPGLGGLEAALDTTFATNISVSASKAVAMDAIATDIHGANALGTLTYAGPFVENII